MTSIRFYGPAALTNDREIWALADASGHVPVSNVEQNQEVAFGAGNYFHAATKISDQNTPLKTVNKMYTLIFALNWLTFPAASWLLTSDRMEVDASSDSKEPASYQAWLAGWVSSAPNPIPSQNVACAWNEMNNNKGEQDEQP